MSSADLKPCPFCGEAKRVWPQNGNIGSQERGWHQLIWCENCGATSREWPTEAEAIAAWNRRPQPSPSSADKISEARLDELIGLGCDGIARHEACALATELTTRRAQSAVVGDGYVIVPKAAIDWLDGAAPDADGKWFGDDAPEGKPYWWRSRFRAMINATQEGN